MGATQGEGNEVKERYRAVHCGDSQKHVTTFDDERCCTLIKVLPLKPIGFWLENRAKDIHLVISLICFLIIQAHIWKSLHRLRMCHISLNS